MSQMRSELLDEAISRLTALSLEEQDRVAIEVLADVCTEKEWVLVVASAPYQKWLTAQSKKLHNGAPSPAA